LLTQELKQKHDDELLAERKEDEMDLSDSESTVPAAKKLKLTVEGRLTVLVYFYSSQATDTYLT